jgi:hypothetical protein
VNYIAMPLLAVGVEGAGIVVCGSPRFLEAGLGLVLERTGLPAGAER